MKLDGASRVCIIVGDPIAQVKSPANMTASLQAAGHNILVVPIHVAPADLATVLDGASAARNLDAVIATVPHKFACHDYCATASDRARALGAVNIMRRNADGGWHGDMFDGEGMVGAIRAAGRDPAGRSALLVGAGGAGSAIGLALLQAGVARLAVHDPDAARRAALIGKLAALHPGKVVAGSADPRGFDLVLNASPAGMRPDDPLPVDVTGLSPGIFAGCVITAPAVSPFIEAARRAGCTATTGADMYRAVQGMMLAFMLRQDDTTGSPKEAPHAL